MAWPDSPFDVYEDCEMCRKPVRKSAYDKSRVDQWGWFGEFGFGHLDCGIKALAKKNLNKPGVHDRRDEWEKGPVNGVEIGERVISAKGTE